MLKSAYLYAEDVALASELCRPMLERGMTVAVQLGDPAQADRLLAELPEELGRSCMPVIAADHPDSIDNIGEIVEREERDKELLKNVARNWRDVETKYRAED